MGCCRQVCEIRTERLVAALHGIRHPAASVPRHRHTPRPQHSPDTLSPHELEQLATSGFAELCNVAVIHCHPHSLRQPPVHAVALVGRPPQLVKLGVRSVPQLLGLVVARNAQRRAPLVRSVPSKGAVEFVSPMRQLARLARVEGAAPTLRKPHPLTTNANDQPCTLSRIVGGRHSADAIGHGIRPRRVRRAA